MNAPARPTRLSVDYFDGVSARAHRVSMSIEGGMLLLDSAELIRQVPLPQVRWSERTRHGARQAHFADGGLVQALDAGQWDAWTRAHALGEPIVVRAQQSWRWTALATTVLLVMAVLGYYWGLPMAARALLPLVPPSVDQHIGQRTLEAIDGRWLRPSALDAATQARWRGLFQDAVRRAEASHRLPGVAPARLTFHFRRGSLGPNALALPDGSVIVTDDLIQLLADREDVLLGILGHELGHVRLRHGLRTLIQTGLLSAAGSVAFGDFSGVLASAPALLGQLGYSRDMEREADDASIAFMRSVGVRPSAMAVFFERMARRRANEGRADTAGPPIAFSSHPGDAERVARFKAADVEGPPPAP